MAKRRGQFSRRSRGAERMRKARRGQGREEGDGNVMENGVTGEIDLLPRI